MEHINSYQENNAFGHQIYHLEANLGRLSVRIVRHLLSFLVSKDTEQLDHPDQAEQSEHSKQAGKA